MVQYSIPLTSGHPAFTSSYTESSAPPSVPLTSEPGPCAFHIGTGFSKSNGTGFARGFIQTATDVRLVSRNGNDTRYLPLRDRKLRRRTMVRKRGERLLYCDHVEGDGEGLLRLACDQDLEGIA